MDDETRRWLVGVAAVAFGAFGALAGCKRPPAAATDGGTGDAGPSVPSASAFVFDSRSELLDAQWATNGDVVALTPSALLRLPPQENARARVLRAPDEEAWQQMALARDADVTVALGQRGALVAFQGAERRPLGTHPGASRLSLAPDGRHVAVGTRTDAVTFEIVDTRSGKVTTTLTVREHWLQARVGFDKSGRWVAVSTPHTSREMNATSADPLPDRTLVRRVDGEGEELVLKDGALEGWVGERLVLETEGAIVLASPESPKTKRVPVCEGRSWLDRTLERVVRICDRRVEIVRVEGGARTAYAAPDLPDGYVAWVAAAREGEDVVVANAEGIVRVDVRGHVARREADVPPLRDGRGRPLAGIEEAELDACAGCVRAPSGERWMYAIHGRGGRRWPLEIRRGRPSASATREVSWGPTDVQPWVVSPRPNARGVDVEHEVEHGVVTRGRLRLGPDAPMLPDEAPHPEERAARDHCPKGRHVTLPNGELWFAERHGMWDATTCLCEDYTCRPFLEGKGGMLDAHRDVVAAGRGARPVTVSLVEPDGGTRAEATLETACHDGRLAPDGRTLVLMCERPGSPSLEPDVPFELPNGAMDLVEVDATTGKVTRTTPVKRPRTRRVTAVGKASYLVEASSRIGGSSWDVVRPGSGEVLASLSTFVDDGGANRALVARLPDGRVEIAGDEALAARALACEKDGMLEPFASCRASVVVKGRFALDP